MSCCCIDVDDPASHTWTTEIKRARRAHFCGECGRCIPSGAPYRKEAALYDGSMSTHKTCRLCAAVRDDRMSCGFAWGRIWDDLRECLAEYDDDDDEWLDPPDFPIVVAP